ncbi:MAG: LysM peptidoglycan-binding domain-containing protein [Caldilineae bacterium]|nr:MAG: LysM peptidoglycan-binding domain-containing protein [Caldilineae bacterium]
MTASPVDLRARARWLGRTCGWLLLVVMFLAGCEAPPPPPVQRPVAVVMRTYTRFEDPLAHVDRRPGEPPKDAVERYLQTFQPGAALPRIFETTFIRDRNGVLLAELFDEGRRTWVGLDAVSPFLIDATIATEDASFYINDGVDPRRIAGAAWQNFEADDVVSGASTITMQLARNLFLLPERRYDQALERKSLEIELARTLNRLFTKDELLEMYLNLINYGHLAYGPEAAARIYFGKPAAALTLAEAALLAGIPQQPAKLDPLVDMTAAKRRQRVVLDLMVRHEFLDQATAERAYGQPLRLNPRPAPAPARAPHFVQYAEQELSARLASSERFQADPGEPWVARRSGMDVITTLDLALQAVAESTARAGVAQLAPRYGMSNSALVALAPDTGEILALVGSLDFDNPEIDGQVNVAISPRQPGSAIKPILYAAALEANRISPASVLWDIPVRYSDGAGNVYAPRNYDGRFHGLVSVRSALANSYNVPAVKLLQTVTPQGMVDMAHALGVASLTRPANAYGLSLALGSGEVSLLELTGAFRVFANQGRYTPVRAIRSYTDSLGRVSFPEDMPVQVISPATAFLLTDILSDNRARTPAFGPNSALHLSRPAAAKTGTTSDWRDNLTVGYTRYLVAGVWTGNSDGAPMRGSSGAAGAAPIWRAFMEAVINDPAMRARIGAPEDEAAWTFPRPPDVVQMDACPPWVVCRKGGEFFSRSWLDAQGGDPLGDAVITAAVAPALTDQAGRSYWPVYCRPDPQLVADGAVTAQERTLLRLMGASLEVASLGEEAQAAPEEAPAAVQAPSGSEAAPAAGVFYPDDELERIRNLAWSLRRGIPVYLGACRDLNFYTVQPGDNWSLLASRVGLTVGELQAANPQAVRASGYLFVGDRILLPRGVQIRSLPVQRHVVVEGESWSAIALQYDVPVRLLIAANPEYVRPFYILHPGDELLVPAPLLDERTGSQTAAGP